MVVDAAGVTLHRHAARTARDALPVWRQPERMADARLVAVLRKEPYTPLDPAVDATLMGLGCVSRDLQLASKAC